jgi:eukaryotic-like serine/threonine-protein kinase
MSGIIGSIISSYKILELIGIGGFPEVFLARNSNAGILVALKILKKAYTQDESYLNRFFSREVEITKTLNHLNIVKLLDYGKYGELLKMNAIKCLMN